ncbi:DUF421 domain-containing protein [Pontibacter sp. JH31]|uniref:DUF421 domain-containing protein n=2 Tax=Pontibacter aquaedesilientis TaxID=2766980 RepID=A0ABR7XBH9_9BACT|nr:DUF421 domain-containing protein [Pontibacter aquaedesilientis]
MEKFFFDNWESILRTFTITILAYVAMIFLLRSSGKRTLSKMNAFDFIVTVALGSSLSAVALNKSIPLIDGVFAFFLLIFLQYAITWLSVRYKAVKHLITSKPTLLLYKGELLHDALKKERITVEELYMAARKKGITDLRHIDVIVLETTGDMTIMPDVEDAQAETLQNVGKV